MKKKRTFISYSKTDHSFVKKAVQILRTQGGEIFLDSDSIKPGANWKKAIKKAIKKSNKVMLFWCCHSSQSEWVNHEIPTALKLKKPIIPIILCNYKIDSKVSDYQWIDIGILVKHECLQHKKYLNTSNLTHYDFLLGTEHNFRDSNKSLLSSKYIKLICYIFTISALLIYQPFPPIFGDFLARLTNLFLFIGLIMITFTEVKKIRQLKKLIESISDSEIKLINIMQAAIKKNDIDPNFFKLIKN